MECDREAETFSNDLFTYLWFTQNFISTSTAMETVADASNFVAEVSQAVIVLSGIAGPTFEKKVEEYFEESGITRKSVFTFLTIYCFNHHARNPDIFDVALNTCTFVYRLFSFCHQKGHVEYIKFASMCWAEIFKVDLRKDFYANGGWENFRKYISRHSYFPKTAKDKASFKLLSAMKDAFPKLSEPEVFMSYFAAEIAACDQLVMENSSEGATTSSPETCTSPEIIHGSYSNDSSRVGTSDESANENNVLNNTIDETSDADSTEEGNTGRLRTNEETSDSLGDSDDDILLDIIRQELRSALNDVIASDVNNTEQVNPKCFGTNKETTDSLGDSDDDILLDIIRQELRGALNDAIASEASDVNNTEQVNPKCLGTNKETTDSSRDSDENMIEYIIRQGMKNMKINTTAKVSNMAIKETVVSSHAPEDCLPIHNDGEYSDCDKLRVLQPMPQPSHGRADEIDHLAEITEYDDEKDSDDDMSFVPQSIPQLSQCSDIESQKDEIDPPKLLAEASEYDDEKDSDDDRSLVPRSIPQLSQCSDLESQKVEIDPPKLLAEATEYDDEKDSDDDRSFVPQSIPQLSQCSDLESQKDEIDPPKLLAEATEYNDEKDLDDDSSYVSQSMAQLSQCRDLKPQKDEIDPPKLLAEATKYDDEKDSDYDLSCIPQPMAQPSQGSVRKPQKYAISSSALLVEPQDSDDKIKSDSKGPRLPQQMVQPFQSNDLKPEMEDINSFPSLPLEAKDLGIPVISKKPEVIKADDSS